MAKKNNYKNIVTEEHYVVFSEMMHYKTQTSRSE